MEFIDTLKIAAKESGTPLTAIGPALGKTAPYVHSYITRGSEPSCKNAADMLGVCGYSLVAMPTDKVPKGALIISGNEKK